MNWKKLLPLPVAALVVATPLEIPKLKRPLPLLTLSNCDYPRALRAYLEAFAYHAENQARARLLVHIAGTEAQACGDKAEVLRERISALKRTLFPSGENSPRLLP